MFKRLYWRTVEYFPFGDTFFLLQKKFLISINVQNVLVFYEQTQFHLDVNNVFCRVIVHLCFLEMLIFTH